MLKRDLSAAVVPSVVRVDCMGKVTISALGVDGCIPNDLGLSVTEEGRAMSISHISRIHAAPHIDRISATVSDALNDRREAREYEAAQRRGQARARDMRKNGDFSAAGYKFRMPDQ